MTMHWLILASSSAPGADLGNVNLDNLWGPIVSTGIVGIVLVMLVLEIGFITKKSADRERTASALSQAAAILAKDQVILRQQADLDELKVANGSLQTMVQDKLLPILTQATDVQRAYVAELARRNDNYRRERDHRDRDRDDDS